ncbi:MAG: proteasome assembly chaperone family protein [Thermoplasmata archaeon]|nr:MAG: proteasome assembly chaperone family protein [Thermoplasmata archaeon]KAA0010517.1 MAG: proteasome assembly chaperone family protein [Thermoplasmata archaeon]
MVGCMEEVRLIEFKEIDLQDGTIIAGFPSIGLVSTIAANYLIDSLGLKQIGALESKYFPTLSVVHSAEPLSPVRIYGGVADRGRKIAIFVSEFRPKPNLIVPIADVIMDWAVKKKCKLLISPEGMVVEGREMEMVKKETAYAIASTDEARNMLVQRGIPQFKNGIIAGVSGVLLNKGKHKNFNVISILSEAHPNYPDARAAAATIEVIASLLDLDINVAPLYEEAERIEQHLQKLHKQAKPVVTTDHGLGPMYG